MYRIIGADRRAYGPIPADQVRQWVAEGRLNARTQVQAVAGGAWQPLSAWPEFAALFVALPPAVPPVIPTTSKSKVAAGLLGIFLGSFGVHNFYLGYTAKAVTQLALTVLGIFPGLFLCGVGMLTVLGVRIWSLVEGILILSGSIITTDADGVPLKD
jgi:TM2 domain-containing membrane protein YozV